ncbi:MAG: metallophosphoesterase family protein [Thermoanaerobaculia bacterium]|nr:metallophosphoesterase family protein [Thermoanaerobaculia bacterium]
MITLLHISDLHFGPPFVPDVGDAVLEKAPTLEPDVLVVSGDFTQRAKEEQFAEAREFLDRLPDVPRVVVPGNHDVPLYRVFERFLRPRALYKEYISEELDQVLDLGEVVIVGLDSTSPRRCISNGRIHLDQLEFCQRAFDRARPDAIRIVVSHHHFAPAPDYEKDQTMPKARRAMDRFVELGVHMILGGHLHRAYIGNSLDVYPGEHRERGMIIVQSGTTTSRRGRAREREKNTFNFIRIDDEITRITHFMYEDEVKDFVPVSRHIFPRPGRPSLTPF